jgi:hypothetical protein
MDKRRALNFLCTTLRPVRHRTNGAHRNLQADKRMPEPFRSTPVFDQNTIPARLRGNHRTKVGVWGVIRVLEGS